MCNSSLFLSLRYVLKIFYVQGQLKRESPIQRETLHKGRVRNIASPEEIIKIDREAHGWVIYSLSWLGCRKNRTTCLLPPFNTDLGRLHTAALQLGSPMLPWSLHNLATLAASTGLFFALLLPIIHQLHKEIQTHVSSLASATLSKGGVWGKQNLSTKTDTLFMDFRVITCILQGQSAQFSYKIQKPNKQANSRTKYWTG